MGAMDALAGLADLDRRYAEALERRRAIDVAEREAHEEVRAAGAALEALMAEKMGGDEPPPKLLSDAQRQARPGARGRSARVAARTRGRRPRCA